MPPEPPPVTADTPLDAVVDALYGLEPDGFVPARDACARGLKALDRREDAAAVRALRRPTTVGWALNLLVREDRVQVDALLSVGEELRRAQSTLSGESLRALTGQRHAVVRAVAGRAAELAAAEGRPLSAPVVDQVARSLDAALTDPDAAAVLVGGRVVGELAYAGLGDLAPPSSPTLTVVAGSPTPRSAGRTAAGDHRRAVRAAHRAVEEATTELEAAEDRLTRARSAADAANLRVASAEETLAAASAELEAARHEEEVAERAATLAAKTQERASRRLEAAEDHLADLHPT